MMVKEEAIRSGTDKRAALNALVQNGRDVFVQRGYHATRVDDLAAAAGVSHGVFYRYFENKNELAIVLTVQAMRAVGDAFVGIPDPVAPTARSCVAGSAATTPRRRARRR